MVMMTTAGATMAAAVTMDFFEASLESELLPESEGEMNSTFETPRPGGGRTFATFMKKTISDFTQNNRYKIVTGIKKYSYHILEEM